jgi:hypothetical protein
MEAKMAGDAFGVSPARHEWQRIRSIANRDMVLWL